MYTPTNWQTGDTITAEKMNNIEQGIVNTPRVAVVSLDAEGFSSASRIFGFVVYATYQDGHWVVISDNDGDWMDVVGFTNPNYRIIPPQYTIIPDENICPFFILSWMLNGSIDVQTTGDIESQSLYYAYGSPIGNAYRIYGDGSIKIIAL